VENDIAYLKEIERLKAENAELKKELRFCPVNKEICERYEEWKRQKTKLQSQLKAIREAASPENIQKEMMKEIYKDVGNPGGFIQEKISAALSKEILKGGE